jgi:hypothetical protein
LVGAGLVVASGIYAADAHRENRKRKAPQAE